MAGQTSGSVGWAVGSSRRWVGICRGNSRLRLAGHGGKVFTSEPVEESAQGQKRTSPRPDISSTLPPKTDMPNQTLRPKQIGFAKALNGRVRRTGNHHSMEGLSPYSCRSFVDSFSWGVRQDGRATNEQPFSQQKR